MSANEYICPNCSCSIPAESVVGEWIKCPSCGSCFQVNYSEQPASVASAGDKAVMGDAGLRKYYFQFRSSYDDFQTKCFDALMRYSPADVFSQMRIVDKQAGYVPVFANIGGNADYHVTGINGKKLPAPVTSMLGRAFSNSDQRFGIERRSSKPDASVAGVEFLEIDNDKVLQLRENGSYVTNEVHYFPYFYLECEYKGKRMEFASLGDVTGMIHYNLPHESRLDERPVFITDSGNEKKDSSMPAIMKIAITLLTAYAVYLLLFEVIGKDKLYDFYNYFPEKIEDATGIHELIAFVLMIPASIIALKMMFMLSMELSTFIYKAIRRGLKHNANRKSLKRYHKIVVPIQKQKQADADSIYGIKLKELYIINELPK